MASEIRFDIFPLDHINISTSAGHWNISAYSQQTHSWLSHSDIIIVNRTYVLPIHLHIELSSWISIGSINQKSNWRCRYRLMADHTGSAAEEDGVRTGSDESSRVKWWAEIWSSTLTGQHKPFNYNYVAPGATSNAYSPYSSLSSPVWCSA